MSCPSHPHPLFIFLSPFSSFLTPLPLVAPPSLPLSQVLYILITSLHHFPRSIVSPLKCFYPCLSLLSMRPFPEVLYPSCLPPLLSFLPHFLVVLLPLFSPPIPTFNSSLVPPSLWTSFLTES